MELSIKQKEIIESTYNITVVIASAASGKTTVLTERVKKLLSDGVEPKSIVLITFTNAAAEEMRQRIGDKGKECFIGTIHSYINYLLLINGYDTSKILNTGDFDYLFKLTYEIKQCPSVNHLLLDEAQDTDNNQWNFILDFVNPNNLFVVGDFRQELYGWRGSDVDTFINLGKRKNSKVFELNENYRNGSNILYYASNIMNSNYVPFSYKDTSVPCSGRAGQVLKAPLNYDWIAKEIESHDTYKDWFILTRYNSQLDKMKDELGRRNIPCITFRQGDLNSTELSEVMNSNQVKILTIHSSKGLENKNVMVQGMLFWNKEEICCSYVAATRAKERLYILNSVRKAQNKKTNTFQWE